MFENDLRSPVPLVLNFCAWVIFVRSGAKLDRGNASRDGEQSEMAAVRSRGRAAAPTLAVPKPSPSMRVQARAREGRRVL